MFAAAVSSSPHAEPSLACPEWTLSSACLERQHLSPARMQKEEASHLTWVARDTSAEGDLDQGQPLQEVAFERRPEGGASHAKIWQKHVLGKRNSRSKGPEVDVSLVHLGKVKQWLKENQWAEWWAGGRAGGLPVRV